MKLGGNLDETLIGLGANLSGPQGEPRETLQAAIRRLSEEGVTVSRLSRFWRTRPMPVSEQPWFVNAVAVVDTSLDPVALLALLHRIEHAFGRVRREVNEARILDLDLLAYGRLVARGPDAPVLPHPRMAERAFVLLPLRDVSPAWVHPVTGQGLESMIANLSDRHAWPEDKL